MAVSAVTAMVAAPTVTVSRATRAMTASMMGMPGVSPAVRVPGVA